jgi:PAS domain S-box-containing protein
MSRLNATPLPDSTRKPIRSLLQRFSFPIAIVAVALSASLVAERAGVISGTSGPYVFFTIAVISTAVHFGFWSGIVATVLSVLATGFFHLDPLYSLRVASTDEATLLLLFLFEGLVLSAISPVMIRGPQYRLEGPAKRYSVAVVLIGCTVLVKYILASSLAPATTPFMLFYAAVMLVAWVGGPGPGLFATVLAALCVAFLFSEPRLDFRIADASRVSQLVLFLFECGVICVFSRVLIVLQNRANESEREARQFWTELQRSEQRLRRQNEVLVDLARQPATPTADLKTVVQQLTEAAASTLEVRRASVWVFDDRHQLLKCLDLFDMQAQSHVEGQQLRVEDYPGYFQAIEKNRSVAAHDARTDERTREFLQPYLLPLGITSMLDAPIRIAGAVVGVVCIEHVDTARTWVPEEEQFIASIADFVSLSIKRQELRQADARIRDQASLLDQARDAIVALDPEGHVRYYNDGAIQLFGWPAGEDWGLDLRQHLAPVGTSLSEITSTIVESGQWVGEMRQRDRAGREQIIAMRWTQLQPAQGRTGLLLIANDVTERRALEQKLARSQRMESLGTLASGIAHDLNNILTPILIGTEMLPNAESTAKRDSLLKTIHSGAERAIALLRQILSFAKGGGSESGPVELTPILRQVADLLGHTFPKTIDFRTHIPSDLAMVSGPSSKIDQILMNLCVNARDAMPTGGRLILSAENRDYPRAGDEQTNLGKPGRYVTVTISDTGTGIPPEIVSQIYDPFFTTKEPGKGTGLGLATTRDIVMAIGGFIRLESQVGQGTRFEVFLPALERVQKASESDSKEMPIGSGERILVVDDDVSITELASHILQTYGYRVITVCDGSEALARCRECGNDLHAILLDMFMPGQDLGVTMEELQKIRPDVPVVVTTGIGGEESAGPGFGESAFLPKPYNASRLLQAIRFVLGPPATPPLGEARLERS